MPILAKLREFLATKKSPSVHSHPEAYTALEIAASSMSRPHLAKVVIVKTGAGDLVMVVLPRTAEWIQQGTARCSVPRSAAGQESEFTDHLPGV